MARPAVLALLSMFPALVLGVTTRGTGGPLLPGMRSGVAPTKRPEPPPVGPAPVEQPQAPEDWRKELADLEAEITRRLQAVGAFEQPRSVLTVQNLLYRRFKAKYVGDGRPFPATYLGELSESRRELLVALRRGDTQAIRESIELGMDWNFVFPPAPSEGSREKRLLLEGWCRSPLALLVRPDEGSLTPLLPGVSKQQRLDLMRAALKSGCADPNYPATYWSGPAAHASFEGDLDALELLAEYGCALEQQVEWVLQPQPLFTLVHAAAFNGHRDVLEYLQPRVSQETWHSLDGDGANSLHTVLGASRDADTARYLIDSGVDGFLLDSQRRSALSMAAEVLPEVAECLLQERSRFEYRWWGKDLYFYSFDGVVLPRQADGSPITFQCEDGQLRSFEEIVVRAQRKELLSLPVMRALLGRKWREFGSRVFNRRAAQTALLLLGVLGCGLIKEADSPLFCAAAAAVAVPWGITVAQELAGLRASESAGAYYTVGGRTTKGDKLAYWKLLDAFNLLLTPSLPLTRGLAALGVGGAAMASAADACLPLCGLLQISLALRTLQYASLYRSAGPLLVTIFGMVSDVTQFLAVYAFVLLGFGNAFYVLFAFSEAGGQTPEYSKIISDQMLWLLNAVDRDLFAGLRGPLATTGDALFWSYILLSYFVLLNLLIAIFNSTYEKVNRNALNEWLFLRQETMLEWEAQAVEEPGLRRFYDEIARMNNGRTVAGDDSLDDSF